MNLLTQPHLLVLIFLSEWERSEQEKVIEYLQAENEVLKEKLGDGRVLLNDHQRRRLAVTGI